MNPWYVAIFVGLLLVFLAQKFFSKPHGYEKIAQNGNSMMKGGAVTLFGCMFIVPLAFLGVLVVLSLLGVIT
jgi:hypothetical protein